MTWPLPIYSRRRVGTGRLGVIPAPGSGEGQVQSPRLTSPQWVACEVAWRALCGFQGTGE